MQAIRCSRGWAVLLLCAILPLASCGDDGPASSAGGGGGPLTGAFVDCLVEGLQYSVSSGGSGLTNATGQFPYRRGDIVTFSVGDILIGQASAQPYVTPLDLVPGAFHVSDEEVTNIARFLQTIDDDDDPANGILVTAPVHTAAAGMAVVFDQTVAAFEAATTQEIQTLTTATTAGVRTLVDAADARDHLETMITATYAGDYTGTYDAGEGGEAPTARLGAWTFEIGYDGAITGEFDPDDGIAVDMSGTISSNGSFTCMCTDFTELAGTVSYNDAGRHVVVGYWYKSGEMQTGSVEGIKTTIWPIVCN